MSELAVRKDFICTTTENTNNMVVEELLILTS
jgi:hypothetical protein